MLDRPAAAAAETKADRKRRLARERVRRCEARRDVGIAVAREVEFSGAVVNMLVRLGWLADAPAERWRQGRPPPRRRPRALGA